MEETWIEFEVVGPIETARYRTTPDLKVIEYWCPHRVPGLARQGWNRTKSLNVEMTARRAVKTGQRIFRR